MTLEQIKNEITERIKEVRDSSSDLSGCASYNDLQKLFKKAIGRVALCESAEDLEAIDGLLSAIEELYNDCNSEATGETSEEVIFDFDFELDSEDTEQNNGQNEADSYKEESEPIDLEEYVKELEAQRSKYGKDLPFSDKLKLRSIYKNSLKKLNAAQNEDELQATRKYYLNAFKRFEKRLERKKLYKEAKVTFDGTYHADAMKKPTVVRACVGCIVALSGAGFGLINARPWPWIWQAWAIVGVGVSYLLISALYAIAISAYGKTAVRRINVTRGILAAIMLVISLILGLVWSTGLTLAGAYIATVPFTFCGAIAYLIYRVKLCAIASKIKKQNKNRAKQPVEEK